MKSRLRHARWQWLLACAVVAVAVITIAKPHAEKPEEARIGDAAPRIALAALSGEARTLQPSDGKLLVLNFWASWCQPCRQEASELDAFYEKHRDKVEVYAVNLAAKDRLADVSAFATNNGLRFPVLLDAKSQAAEAYHIAALPTTYWIGADGIVAGRRVGPVDQQWLEALLPPGE